MSDKILREYTLYLLKTKELIDNNGNKYLSDVRDLVIGSNHSDSLTQAYDILFKDSLIEHNTLSFKLNTQYFDNELQTFVTNPLVDETILTNESKLRLKLIYNNNDIKWFDFIVKTKTEISSEHSFQYDCVDLFTNELGKTGYGITFNDELNNNTGTIYDLANIVLKNSDWTLDVKNSDNIYQFLDEPLYQATITSGSLAVFNPLSNKLLIISPNTNIFIYYSTIVNKDNFLQLIYHENDDYVIDDNGCILEELDSKYSEYYGGWYCNNTPIYNDDSTISIGGATIQINNISTQYKGRRLVRSQKTAYDKIAGKNVLVYQYNPGQSGYDLYKYIDTTYKSPTYVSNYIINGTEPTTNTGWNSNGNSISVITNNKDKSFLQFINNNQSTQFYNSGAVNLANNHNGFAQGNELIVRLRAYSDINNLTPITINNDYEVSLATFSINDTTGIFEIDHEYFSFESGSSWNIDYSFKSIITDSLDYQSHYKEYWYYDMDNDTYIPCVENEYSAAASYYIKDSNYYYQKLIYNDDGTDNNITLEDLNNSKIGIFIKTPDSSTVYFDHIELYEPVKSESLSSLFGNTHYYAPGEYQPAYTQYTYYYYVPNSGYNDLSQIKYKYSNIIDIDLNANNIIPKYTYDKIKNISIEKSNIFNIIQELSEAFECWACIDVERDEYGNIAREDYRIDYITNFDADTTYYTKQNEQYNPIEKEDVQFKRVVDDDKYNSNINYYIKNESGQFILYNIPDVYHLIYIKNNTEWEDNSPLYYYDIKTNNYVLSENYETGVQYYQHDYNKAYKSSPALYILNNIISGQTYYIKTPNREKKYIKFKNYIDIPNYAGFRYGLNLNSITREIISDEIATKIYVEDNINEYANNGICSIANSKDNPTKQSFIYNLTYYTNNGILDTQQVNTDLNQYYQNIQTIYDENAHNEELLLNYQGQLVTLDSEIESYTTFVYNLSSNIDTLKANLLAKHSISYEDALIPTEEAKKLLINNTSDFTADVKAITDQYTKLNEYSAKLKQLRPQLNILNSKINECIIVQTSKKERIRKLNYDFEKKYTGFIQEGVWTDSEQLDNNLYYYDALSVANTSKSPQVTYTISVTDISMLEDFTLYNFNIGDKTSIYDNHFFGNQKEEVIISEIEYNLTNPTETTIKVQNYKTRFEDLFQRISATIQTLEYKNGAYSRAASILTSDGTISSSIMQKTFSAEDYFLLANNNITIGPDGISVSDSTNTVNRLRFGSSGISATNDAGHTWTPILDYNGLYINNLHSGYINTNQVEIYGDSENPSFRWDSIGLTAYSTHENNTTNYNKFVRLDKYGIYGVDINNTDINGWKPDPSLDTSIYEQIKENSRFGLTYDGFFLRSDKESGGYIEISSDNCIKIKSIIDNNYSDRIVLGRLDASDPNSLYGLIIYNNHLDPVMKTDIDGELWLSSLLRIGYDYNDTGHDKVKLGTIETYNSEGEQSTVNVAYTKIMSITGTAGNNTHINNDNETFVIYDDGYVKIAGNITAREGKIGALIIDNPKGASGDEKGIHTESYSAANPQYGGFMLSYNGDMYINNGIFRGHKLDIRNYSRVDNLTLYDTYDGYAYKGYIKEEDFILNYYYYYNSNTKEYILASAWDENTQYYIKQDMFSQILIGNDQTLSDKSLHGIQITSGNVDYINTTVSNTDYDIETSYYYLATINGVRQYVEVPIKNNQVDTPPNDVKIYILNSNNNLQVSERDTTSTWYWKEFEPGETYKTIQKSTWKSMLNLQSNSIFFFNKHIDEENADKGEVNIGLISLRDVGTLLGTQGIYNRLRFSEKQYKDADEIKNILNEKKDIGEFLLECRPTDKHLSIKLV